MPFTVLTQNKPTLTSFTPTSGVPGEIVTLTGSNFINLSGVTLNGAPASYNIVSGTQLQVTVPAGASSGKFSVSSPGGTAFSSTAFTLTSTTSWGGISGTLSNQADLQSALNSKLAATEKGVVNGVATLGSDGKVPSAQLPDTRPQRTSLSVTTPSLADGATADVSLAMGKGYTLYSIQTSAAAWVRVYTRTDKRTADVGRDPTVDPTGSHGVVVEAITADGNLTALVNQGIPGANLENSPTSSIPIAVTNRSGATAAITITITFMTTES